MTAKKPESEAAPEVRPTSDTTAGAAPLKTPYLTVTRYTTSDGKEHASVEDASAWDNVRSELHLLEQYLDERIMEPGRVRTHMKNVITLWLEWRTGRRVERPGSVEGASTLT